VHEQYPNKKIADTKLIVIDSKAYKALAKQLSGLIDGWEGK
jgi:hypothetical protein